VAMTDTPTRRPVRRSLVALLAAAALLVGACAAGAAPGTTPIPTAPAETGSLTRDEAVARVLASDPGFAGIGPLDPDLIGQSAWYEVSPGTVGWRVTITKGWGDCQAGCISRHVWVFEVDGTGTVTLVEEIGDPLEDGTGDGDGVPPVEIPAEGGPWIAGRAVAGPTCPVAQEPPDPACADRPVEGAVVVIRDPAGRQVAEATTAPDGTYLAAVPQGGTYVVEAQPVDGVMGAPGPIEIVVPAGAGAWAVADLGYDTGIR
jgi:hypothetical protein